MRCEDVALELAEAAEGSEGVDRKVLGHVEHCLRCQAEAVQYRKLLKALRHLRTQYLVPAPGTLAQTLAALQESQEHQAIRSILTGRRGAYIGALGGAAVAAGAAAAA
ncbi:MAG: hypothetical protein KY395_07640, partial [Actinobacteria bacterium]|nr:hypothetical protein [Actinomycetota bacterium]